MILSYLINNIKYLTISTENPNILQHPPAHLYTSYIIVTRYNESKIYIQGLNHFKVPMRITKEILYAYYNNQFKLSIPYGPIGIGKSVLALRILIETYYHKQIKQLKKTRKKWNYSHLGKENVLHTLKTHWFFKIQQYINYVSQFDIMHREIMCVIDDAGVDISSQNWQDELVKAFGIYMNLPRTRWGGIILTSPLQTNILKRIRVIPNIWTGRIARRYGRKHPSHAGRWARRVTWYQRWTHPDGKHSGVNIVARDKFSGWINDFIYEWYAPLRAKFAQEQEQKIQSIINKRAQSEPDQFIEELVNT